MARVIIIGGGFAGLTLARKLNNSRYEVLLIDRFNHHQFQPLFYQVATAGLEPSNISFPFRRHFRRSKNIDIRVTKVERVDTALNMVYTGIGYFSYDHLIIATGADTNFFGNKNFEENAFPMKSTTEALYLRYRLLQNFENALSVKPEELESLLNIVVVGGGPTGVELAGALAEMKKHVLPADYHDFDFSRIRVILVEGGSKTLGTMSEQASKSSKKYLEELGVEIKLNTKVKDYDGKQISFEDGNAVKTNTVIWAAGIKGNVIDGLSKEAIAGAGRFKVDRFNLIEGYKNIYAVGDIAMMATPKYPKGHPQVGNVAITQAKRLGNNFLKNDITSWKEYEYLDKGSMATVGKHKAVVDLPFLKFSGYLAWFGWMGLHLILLMGFKNRLFVFIDWVIAYFTNNSSLRLIFKPFSGKKN